MNMVENPFLSKTKNAVHTIMNEHHCQGMKIPLGQFYLGGSITMGTSE